MVIILINIDKAHTGRIHSGSEEGGGMEEWNVPWEAQHERVEADGRAKVELRSIEEDQRAGLDFMHKSRAKCTRSKGRVNKPIFGRRVSRNLREHLRWRDRAGIAAAGSWMGTFKKSVGRETKKKAVRFLSLPQFAKRA